MSRIGNKPVSIIDGVKVSLADGTINVEGPKGKLSYTYRPEVDVAVEDGEVKVSRARERQEFTCVSRPDTSLVNNMIIGVKEGYEKKLELQGVGYVCQIAGKIAQAACGLGKRTGQGNPRWPGSHLPRPDTRQCRRVATNKKSVSSPPKFERCGNQNLTRVKEFGTLVNTLKSNLVSQLSNRSSQLTASQRFAWSVDDSQLEIN